MWRIAGKRKPARAADCFRGSGLPVNGRTVALSTATATAGDVLRTPGRVGVDGPAGTRHLAAGHTERFLSRRGLDSILLLGIPPTNSGGSAWAWVWHRGGPPGGGVPPPSAGDAARRRENKLLGLRCSSPGLPATALLNPSQQGPSGQRWGLRGWAPMGKMCLRFGFLRRQDAVLRIRWDPCQGRPFVELFSM